MSSLSPAPMTREDYLMFAVAEHFRALAALAHGDIEGATVLQESGSDARKLYDNYLDGWWDSGLPLQPGEPVA